MSTGLALPNIDDLVDVSLSSPFSVFSACLGKSFSLGLSFGASERNKGRLLLFVFQLNKQHEKSFHFHVTIIIYYYYTSFITSSIITPFISVKTSSTSPIVSVASSIVSVKTKYRCMLFICYESGDLLYENEF